MALELAYAKPEHLDDILKLFRKHREIFPHLIPKSLAASIDKEQMIWSMGVALQFKTYQRKQRLFSPQLT